MKHCTFSLLPAGRITCFLIGLVATLFVGCVVDSDDPKPDSTHMFIVNLDEVSTFCTDGATIASKIEIFISTREEGTPFRPDEDTDYETVTIKSGQAESVNLELEAGFALEDDVLIEARITTYDAEASLNIEEEFWHSVYYSADSDCWYKFRSLNPFSGCIDGSDDDSELFDTSHSTSMASPFCQVYYEWRARIERI